MDDFVSNYDEYYSGVNSELKHDTEEPAQFSKPKLHCIDVRDGSESTRALSESGNSWRLFDLCKNDVFYVPEQKAWLVWDGARWTWDFDGSKVRSLAAGLPALIYEEGMKHFNESLFFAKWARISQKEFTVSATVALFRDFERVRMPLGKVDADLFKAGMDGGRKVLNLENGDVAAAKQADFITKSLNVQGLGDSAKAERWREFLFQVFGDDRELLDWLKRWCGYTLSGSTREQFFVFGFGCGSNGKSVLAELLRYILGDYAKTIEPESLFEVKRQTGAASPDLADLVGARLVISSETEDGAALTENLIKKLSGGDTLKARKLYAAPVEFEPQFKLFMIGNHKPVIRGTDDGIWRRVRLLPFKRVFKPEDRDPQLLDKLKAEAPHILAWMLEGCLDWQQRGLADIPTTIQQATGDYQNEQDLIGRWIAECCDMLPSYEETATALYKNYQAWCLDNGLRPASNVSLGRRLSERGFVVRQSHGKRYWQGLAIGLNHYASDYRTASGG